MEPDENYDGVSLGFLKDAPVIVIWDENKWGKSSEGKVNFVFACDDLDQTYVELQAKGVHLVRQQPYGAEKSFRSLIRMAIKFYY
ncbi:hypothetical protein D3C73_1297490 [compost metagenome]